MKKDDLKVPPAPTPALPAVVGLPLVPASDCASPPSFTRMNIESAGSGRAWCLRKTLSGLARACGFFKVSVKVVFVLGLASVSTLFFLYGVGGSVGTLVMALLSSGVGGTTLAGLSDALGFILSGDAASPGGVGPESDAAETFWDSFWLSRERRWAGAAPSSFTWAFG